MCVSPGCSEPFWPWVHSFFLMQSTVEELDGNKVKLRVTVPADEFERAIDDAFKKLAREVRVPGFRPGKAPRQLLEARFGPDVAREQALRDSLPEYYVRGRRGQRRRRDRARRRSRSRRARTTGDVEFEAVVEVRPIVRLVGYDELHGRAAVRQRSTTPPSTSRSMRCANGSPTSPTPSTRSSTTPTRRSTSPARSTVSRVEGLTATDFLYRVGSGMVVARARRSAPRHAARRDPRVHRRRSPSVSASAPAKRSTFRVRREGGEAEDPPRAHRRVGRRGERVRHGRRAARRHPPSPRDDAEAAGADGRTRQGARSRRRPRAGRGAGRARRERDPPPRRGSRAPAVAPEGRRSSSTSRRPARNPRRSSTRCARARRAACSPTSRCAPSIAQEAIEPTDDELDAEIVRLAERLEQKPERVRRDLEKQGALEAVRSDVARGKALQFLVDHATVVDEEGNEIDLTFPKPMNLTTTTRRRRSTPRARPDERSQRRSRRTHDERSEA